MRRRIYLLRHAEVSYLGAGGRLVRPEQAALTPRGEAQASALGRLFADVSFDRVVTSGLPRTLETARRLLEGRREAPAVESWPDFSELRGGKLRDLPKGALGEALLGAFRGAVPEATRFLGGETVGELFDRVLPALERLLGDASWDCALLILHGAVNRALLSWALTGARTFLGHIEQSPGCINILDFGEGWVVRALNFRPDDPLFLDGRDTTMEKLHAELLGASR
jgi:broad specificity phosphatase PhoE